MALIVAGRLITGTELLCSRTPLKRCTALLFFDPGTQRMKKLRYAIQKNINQAGMNLIPPPPSQNSHAVRLHCTAE